MSTKAEALAAKLEQMSKEFAAQVQGLSNARWQETTAEEGWTVAATAHHVAGSAAPISMIVQSVATGSPMPPFTADGLNQMNAEHAKEHAGASKGATLTLLSEQTAPAANLVRGLSDEQLARSAMLFIGAEMTAEQVIENILIGHIAGHAASIGAVVAR